VLRDSLVASDVSGVARAEATLRPDAGPAAFSATVRGQDDSRIALAMTAGVPPTLVSASPTDVTGGDTVRLRGTGLSGIGDSPLALFGTQRGDVIEVVGDSAARVIVPACVSTGSVAVRLVSTLGQTSTVALTARARTSLAIAVGRAITAPASASCLTLPGAGAQYLAVTQLVLPTTSTQPLGYRLGATASGSAIAGAPETTGASLSRRERVEAFFRERERVQAPLVRDGAQPGAQAGARMGVALEALEVGRSRSFRVLTNLCLAQSAGCGLDFGTVTATLKYLGDHVAVYVDDARPSGAGLSDAEMQQFGALFDRTLYSIDVQTFGTASDVDGDSHVIVLMTPAVNGLTATADCASAGYVAGFFFADDLVPRAANSNHAEIFYTAAPDPDGVKSCAHSVATIKRIAPATFIHEFQHMISFNQHAIVRGGTAELSWLNEGLSHIAEELGARYYEGLLPTMQPSAAGRAKTSPAQLFPDSASDFISGDIRNAFSYLTKPSQTSLTSFANGGSLDERGASWLFLRWLADQKGEAILSRLVQTSRTGVANVRDKSGEGFETLFNDFTIATFADSIPGTPRASTAVRYHFAPNRNLRAMFERALGRFPISASALFTSGPAWRGQMVPGSMAFHTLTTADGDPTAFTLAFIPDGAAFPSELGAQVGVFRIR
jgi:hypothetical protein